ncbi:MAG: DUF6350 family protein [Actinomycetota bacterium]|nr:DUF6350 family protein [Actinomycetota bacterium]
MALTQSAAAESDATLAGPTKTAGARARVLLIAALGPLLVGYVAVAASLALVAALAPRAHFTTLGVLQGALPGWLAGHQVPIDIQGARLGALPLLPTLLLMLLIGKTAAGAVERIDADAKAASRIVFAVIAAHAAFGLVAALVCAGGPVTADPLAGFYYPALLSGVAAGVGVVRRIGLPDWALDRLDALALRGLRVGLLAVAALLAIGAATVFFGLATSFTAAREMFAHDGVGGGIGMLLLSVGYLPNAVIAGTAFAAGPGFALGLVSIGPLDFTGGPVPALPLLSALPEVRAPWWPVLFLLPLAVGVMVGRMLREVDQSPVARLRVVAVASVVVAVSFAVLGGSASGALGGGPFDPVDLRATALSVALVAWVAIPAGLVTWFGGPRPVHEGPVGLLDDPEEEVAEEEFAGEDSLEEDSVADDAENVEPVDEDIEADVDADEVTESEPKADPESDTGR